MTDDLSTRDIARRALLRSVGAGLVAGIAAEAGQLTPRSVEAGRALHQHEPNSDKHAADVNAPEGKAPQYFSSAQYRQLSALSELIIPSDIQSGGAIAAGVPAFIDLLASENKEYQRRLSGGLFWLDAACISRFQHSFVECTPDQQYELLELIAFRPRDTTPSDMLPGIEFFEFLRDLTLDGYFTSEIGIRYLEFQGNQAVASFTGCPEAEASEH